LVRDVCRECGSEVSGDFCGCLKCGSSVAETVFTPPARSGQEQGPRLFILGIGRRFGRYVIEREIARGGMGVVYCAQDTNLGRTVALKLIAPRLADDERFQVRFLREARASAAIDHPGVIPVYESGVEEGLLFISTRFVEGPDMSQLIRERSRLEPELVCDLVSQVAGALDHAHERGLIHRDVKPANVLLAPLGEDRFHCYLTDFGLSGASVTSEGLGGFEIQGTPDYMAPEVALRRGSDSRSDIYSLGCLAWHCLTGSPPFRRGTVLETISAQIKAPVPEFPRGNTEDAVRGALEDTFSKVLEKGPEGRFETAAAFSRRLTSSVHTDPAEPRRTAVPQQSWLPRRKRRAAVGLSAVAVGVVLGLMWWMAPGSGPSEKTLQGEQLRCVVSADYDYTVIARSGDSCAPANGLAQAVRRSSNPNANVLEIPAVYSDGPLSFSCSANEENLECTNGEYGMTFELVDETARGAFRRAKTMAEVRIPDRASRCSPGVFASASVTCAFAGNVARRFRQGEDRYIGPIYSPVTGQSYGVVCVPGPVAVCRGGRNAIVYIRS
jgi:serine/threonine-protein kinase